MKKSILFLTTMLSVVLLHAQTTEINDFPLLSNEEFFTQSELVIEGRYIKTVFTYDTKGNRNKEDIYSILAIKVIRVFKGDLSLTGDTVFIVNKGGTLGVENIYLSERVNDDEVPVFAQEEIQYVIPQLLKENDIRNISEYMPLIYFFTTSDFPENRVHSKYSFCKKYKFIKNGENKLYVCENKILGLNNLVFQNREDFYNYMRQFEGFTVPEAEPLPEKKQTKEQTKEIILDSLLLK